MFRPRFLFILAIPFIAKLIANGGFALGFIYEGKTFIGPLCSLAWLVLFLTGVAFAVRYLFARDWIKASVLAVAVLLSIVLPQINFHPERVIFERNKQSYLAAINADPSLSPKFKYFPMRELFDFPGGGTFYYVIYDETGEILRPESNRSPVWLAKHSGFTSAGVKGMANPHATIEVSPLKDGFFLVVERY